MTNFQFNTLNRFNVFLIICSLIHPTFANEVDYWKQTFDFLNSTLDTSTQQCNDFYGFACRNWIKNNEYPKGLESVFRTDIEKLFENTDTNHPDTYVYFKQAKIIINQSVIA